MKKLYYFYVTVRDGEHEYSYHCALRARSEATATKRAQKYARTFLCCRMIPYQWAHDGRGRKLYPIQWEASGGSEYRIVEMEGVSETTEQELLNRLLI